MKRNIALLCVLGLGACSSLESVPLVYVSGQRVGLSASVGSPESPAPEIVIGFRSVDAAYVPVVVSRECAEWHQLEPRLYSTSPGVPSNCSVVDYNSVILGNNNLERERDGSLRIVNPEEGDAVGITRQPGVQSMQDALSVFGSFNSASGANAQAQGASATLSLGKTFATGVAAQLFSDDIGDASIVDATSNCFNRGLALLVGVAGDERKPLVTSIVRACDASRTTPPSASGVGAGGGAIVPGNAQPLTASGQK